MFCTTACLFSWFVRLLVCFHILHDCLFVYMFSAIAYVFSCLVRLLSLLLMNMVLLLFLFLFSRGEKSRRPELEKWSAIFTSVTSYFDFSLELFNIKYDLEGVE